MSEIDDLRRENALLRSSEARFRALLEKSAEAISLTAADGSTEYVTPCAARLLGWTQEEMATRTMREQVIPEDRVRIAAALEQLVRSGERDLAKLELRVRHRDGSILWVESWGTNLLDDPDVRAIVGNYRDITAQKHAEEAAREGQRLVETAQAIAHIGSWTSSLVPQGRLVWSAECYRIFGVPQGTPMTVESFFACVHPADREDVRRAIEDATERNAPYDIEHRVQWPDGQVRWVHERASVERDEAGRATQLIGTVQDVTDRHLAIAALRASEQRYRRMVENTSEGVWTYDAQAITTFVNTRMAEMLGYTVAEVVGQPIYLFMDETDRDAAEALVGQRSRGIAGRSDFRLRRKNGTHLWVSIQSNPLFDAAGRLEAVLALLTDVSARRIADEARARLVAIVASSEDAILSTSLDGAITSWNRGAEKLYQYTADEIIGQHASLLIPSSNVVAEDLRIRESIQRAEPIQHYETRRRRKDGSVVEVALTISPIRDVGGVVIGASGIARDLTARREAEAALERTEEQFRQAQKMEAVGRLAGGIAHDFNNLLSIILSYSSLAVDALKEGDPLRDDMLAIQSAGERATQLTRQLLAFSRRQILQPRVIDLNAIVDGMQSMLRRLLGEDVELAVRTAPDIGRTLADPGQIEQVVLNLAVNARDAMLDGGMLTIETANVSLSASSISGPLEVAAGDYVMLAVSDNGTGMDDATRGRIFEPFFTTKEPGKGTGLGLSTVFGIVKQSGGTVSVYSEPGHGTTFKVYLPRTDQVADAAVSVGAPALRRGTETILLVEDEEEVRVVARTILLKHGYQVLEAANGGEALLIAQDFESNIDLLLTDVVMPRLSGRRVAEHLAKQRPGMRVLFISGYTDDAVVRHGVLADGVAFLQKPFTPTALLRGVREALERPHGVGV